MRAIMRRSLKPMAIADASLTTSDAARVTGLTAHTLRYYREVANASTPVSSADSDHSRAASSGSAA